LSKKRSPLKELLLYLIFAPIIEINRLAPRKLVYAFWYCVAGLFWVLHRKRRRVVLDNLRAVYPDLPEQKIRERGFRSVVLVIRAEVEFCWISELTEDNLEKYVHFEGVENLEKAYGKGKGVILAFIHQYSAEMVSSAVGLLGMPFLWVIREMDNRYLDKKLVSIRETTGIKVIYKEKAMRLMLRGLREGKIIGITTDQKASFNAVWVKFMGLWSPAVKAPAVFHLRTGAPIVPVFSIPRKEGGHKAYLLPEIEYEPTGETKKDVFMVSQMLADIQSEFINRHPELWLWAHRRWSIKPTEKAIAESKIFLEEAQKQGIKPDISSIQ